MRSRPIRFAILLAGLAGSILPAAAAPKESAADFLAGLYREPIYNPLEDGGAAKLTGPALRALETSEKQSEEGDGLGCIDFMVTVSGQDYDAGQIAKTLTIGKAPAAAGSPAVAGAERWQVGFRQFDTPVTLLYDLVPVNGEWRIADIASPGAGGDAYGWTLSKLCE